LKTPPLLIIAGAGSGKTNTLAHRVAHLVVSGVDPRRIMLLTFSRRAAAEMQRRVEQALGSKAGAIATEPAFSQQRGLAHWDRCRRPSRTRQPTRRPASRRRRRHNPDREPACRARCPRSAAGARWSAGCAACLIRRGISVCECPRTYIASPKQLAPVRDSPFGPACTARNKWDPIGSRRPGHLHLVGVPYRKRFLIF
jgi:hypothetical protein